VDSLTQTGSTDLRDEVAPNTIHTLGVVVSEDQQLAYTVGVGGFFVLDPTEEASEFVGHVQVPSFDVLALAGTERVAVGGSSGFRLVDVSDPTSPSLRAGVLLDGVSGLAWDGASLWTSTHYGQVSSWAPGSGGPTAQGTIDDLGNVWDLVLDDEGRGYVGDNGGQIHVLDLGDPAAPSLLGSVPVTAGIQDLSLSGDLLVAALGAGGFEVFSLADPLQPTSVARVETGSSVVAVDLADDLLWAADIDGVLVVDLNSPSAPKVLGFEASEQWTMGIAAMGDSALGAGWSFSDRYTLSSTALLPVVDPNPSELTVPEGGGEVTFHLTNRGSAELVVSGASVSDERLSLSLEEVSSLAPGEQIQLSLIFDGAAGDSDVEATLCLATNDPSQPLMELPVTAGGSGQTSIAVGQPAVDFSLPSLDGVTYQLSNQIGSPVVLVYFATW